MNTKTLVLLVLAAGVIGGTIYYCTRPEPQVSIGAKGNKQRGSFAVGEKQSTVRIGGQKSGVSVNIPNQGLIGQFISGIFHPTNQDDATSGTTDTTTIQA